MIPPESGPLLYDKLFINSEVSVSTEFKQITSPSMCVFVYPFNNKKTFMFVFYAFCGFNVSEKNTIVITLKINLRTMWDYTTNYF